ncbi:MAG: HAMP domain-containing histidine kinase [Gemmatimonadaceae bacterium]|nr:HAMP domain-containing histidine kinase [Gemmatimonadaceae bacterium]
MKPLDFRKRLFLVLSMFALLPAAVLTGAWTVAVWRALPFAAAGAAWERVAASGERASEAVRDAPLSDAQRQALATHERELHASVVQARRLDFVARRFAPVVIAVAIAALVLLWIVASRVAGHLSRQLSRPIHELVGWTEMIEQGMQPPTAGTARGAPEFETLRQRMRAMSTELAAGRERAVEAERLVAFRETARRVAHELKNPLTPMQLAIATVKRAAPDSLHESVRVLEEETARLARMARSFAQFGRLPDGQRSDVDVAELLRATASACVPSHLALRLELDDDLPRIRGYHDALQRAVMNVVLNAVDACGNAGTIAISATHQGTRLRIEVADTGAGIAPEHMATIWEPYVTHKAGGTGLGLAIAEQAVRAHGGSVRAESRPGEGARIIMELPADADTEPSSPRMR